MLKKCLIGIVTGLANGLFGAGGGTILVPAMQKFLDIQTHKSHATAIAVILPLSVVSIIVYRNVELPPISVILAVSAGGLAGGYVGAQYLTKFSSKTIHRIFGVFIAVAAVRMIF